jgi:IclR family acetate operon transcriptional repressor
MAWNDACSMLRAPVFLDEPLTGHGTRLGAAELTDRSQIGILVSKRGRESQNMSILARTTAVLDELAKTPSGLSQAQIGSSLQLAKPTVSRLLQTMVDLDLVRRDEARRVYVLGPAVIRWGMAAVGGLELRAVAHPYLEALRDTTGETVHLGVLDGSSVIYLDRVESPQAVRMASRLGSAMPAHSTSLGKCLLAYAEPSWVYDPTTGPLRAMTDRTITDPARLLAALEVTRERGYSLEQGENEEGVVCVAAPLFDHSGQIVAALSVSTPEFRLERPDQHAPAAVMAAEAISAALGFRSGLAPSTTLTTKETV